MASGIVNVGWFYKAGDVVNLAAITCPGHLTTSGTRIEFHIPLSRPIQASRATISGNVYIRHVGGGYLANNVAVSSLGTVYTEITAGGIYVQINASSAFRATNNTPIDALMATGSSVTFS